ncbi:MAG: HAMP domain-containing histidine kinase, partial [Alphaproteobacteria bacterium]|nr:HAMP domain-containing histidine kinase [Alphaproteobacteria bacterium]
HGSGRHLLNLINDILDLAKIEAGSFILKDAELDLGSVIGDELALVGDQAQAAGVKLESRVDPAIPLVMADERAIRQIIKCLLSNAFRFTPSGGEITGFAERAEGHALAFGIADTGTGISEHDQATIFENFGQGRHDVATADRGVGLGLAIVKGLVEAHGGQIALQSTLGKGTRVKVFLPLARRRPAAASRAA